MGEKPIISHTHHPMPSALPGLTPTPCEGSRCQNTRRMPSLPLDVSAIVEASLAALVPGARRRRHPCSRLRTGRAGPGPCSRHGGAQRSPAAGRGDNKVALSSRQAASDISRRYEGRRTSSYHVVSAVDDVKPSIVMAFHSPPASGRGARGEVQACRRLSANAARAGAAQWCLHESTKAAEGAASSVWGRRNSAWGLREQQRQV